MSIKMFLNYHINLQHHPFCGLPLSHKIACNEFICYGFPDFPLNQLVLKRCWLHCIRVLQRLGPRILNAVRSQEKRPQIYARSATTFHCCAPTFSISLSALNHSQEILDLHESLRSWWNFCEFFTQSMLLHHHVEMAQYHESTRW